MIALKNVAEAIVSYAIYRSAGNRAVYHGPEHTDLVTDELILVGNDPVKNNDSFGNRRSSFKLLRSTDVAGTDGISTLTRDAKVEILTSLPVGMANAEIDELFARAAEAAKSTAVTENLAQLGQVQQ